MFILMVLIFVLGYTAIALEHPLKVDKAATAILIGVLTWTAYMLGVFDILSLGHSLAWKTFLESSGYQEFMVSNPSASKLEVMQYFIAHHEILHHLGEISEILFFLLGAMTIVEVVDQHNGFEIITDKIKTTQKVKLLWIVGILTFFMSAVLDNLTTTIVMVALLRKLIANKEDRWFFSGMVILSANAGGAWSPIGDVTTIMLWIKGQVTTVPIIRDVFLASFVSMTVPLFISSFILKGHVQKPTTTEDEDGTKETSISKLERNIVFIIGIGALLFVPVFKTITHLPPWMGMLLGLGILWLVTENIHKRHRTEVKTHLTVAGILKRIDVTTILFFLGILTAVASLQSAGHLALMGEWLDKITHKNIYVINLFIGLLSSIVDNVPLVAGAMGMYDIHAASVFQVDGPFWQFLAYCAGTGGSILIIGSAAGVAAMGMEKIDFIWYLKRISWIALIGYFAGAAVYIGQYFLIHV